MKPGDMRRCSAELDVINCDIKKGDGSSEIVPHERIEKRIHEKWEKKVMLDADLAELYGVETRALNQAVTRNIERFPEDFMFTLTLEEAKASRS